MPSSIRLLAAALLLSTASPVFAQSQPGVGTAVEAGKPSLLDAGTQARIRDYVARQTGAAAAQTDAVAVGAVVPDTVTLYALPEDSGSEVPTVTSYRFAAAGGRIIVVDPRTRTVVQLIDR